MNRSIGLFGVLVLIFMSFLTTDSLSQAIISKKGSFSFGNYEYKPSLGKVVKREKHSLGSSEIVFEDCLLNYSMWEVKTELEQTYFLELECRFRLENGGFRTFISEDDLTELIDAIYIMERSVKEDVKTTANYLDASFELKDNAGLGYTVSEGQLEWSFTFDTSNSSAVVRIPAIRPAKRLLESVSDTIDRRKRGS